jgi:hypothetical protein
MKRNVPDAVPGGLEKPKLDIAGVVADFPVRTGRSRLELPDDLPLETWSTIGTNLVSVSDSSIWWIGDWLVFGQERYPDRYRMAMAETSLHYQTLRNYAWIARRFEVSRRRDDLTFQHHVEVAAMAPQIQDHWLDLASNLGWSRNELRRQIRQSESTDDDRSADTEIHLSLRVPKDRIERWESAARQANRNLVDWIAAAVDQAL